MANKNTRAARKLGLSNNPETTEGSGRDRRIVERHAEKIFKGSICDTGWNNTNSKHRRAKKYGN